MNLIMTPGIRSRRQLDLRYLVALCTGVAVAVVLLEVAELFRVQWARTLGEQNADTLGLQFATLATMFNSIALAVVAACTVSIFAKYTNFFCGQFFVSVGVLLSLLAFVLTTRAAAIAFWDQFNFSLPDVTIAALHSPIVPGLLVVIAAITLANKFMHRRSLMLRLTSYVTIGAFGICVAYFIAMFVPVVLILHSL